MKPLPRYETATTYRLFALGLWIGAAREDDFTRKVLIVGGFVFVIWALILVLREEKGP